MLRHGLFVVLISLRVTCPPASTPMPSGVARWRFSTTAWNSADDGRMPCVAATHAAISGSRARPWAVPCAAAYCFYIAASHLIWSEASPNGQGWPMGWLQAAVFSLPGFALLRACARRA